MDQSANIPLPTLALLFLGFHALFEGIFGDFVGIVFGNFGFYIWTF
jgi:hypothetical protein